MKHAYLIMAHGNFRQLAVLLELLDDPRNDIYLHIDKKAPAFSLDDLLKGIRSSSVVRIPSMSVTWGGQSQIECQQRLLKKAVETHHDYYHLLSGSDLPIKSMDYIDAFFQEHRGTEFVHFTSSRELGNLTADELDRIRLYHPMQDVWGRHRFNPDRLFTALQRILGVNRLRNKALEIGKGANWFDITESFAHYVVNRLGMIRQVFYSGHCADEFVLQTLILNSPFKEKIYKYEINHDSSAIVRLIDWKRGNPYVFRMADWQQIIESDMLFARKFDQNIDSNIIKMVAGLVQG